MASFNKYQKGVEALVEGINAGSDVWKVALSNRTPVVASDATLTDAVEISAGNGYTAGGNTTTIAVSETGGTTTVKYVVSDLCFSDSVTRNFTIVPSQPVQMTCGSDKTEPACHIPLFL